MLVGRDEEIREIQQLLQRSELRLLTLTGVGGVGKTRLAQAVIEESSSLFPDGVLAVELASLNGPEYLVSTLLQEFSACMEPAQAPLATLAEFLHTKHLLLFLDNFEQIVAGAPLLFELLARCPNFKILITSRELLRVRG